MSNPQSLEKLDRLALWTRVEEDTHVRYVAEFHGYIIDAWYYTDGPDAGTAFFRVSRPGDLSIGGHEFSLTYARGQAVKTVLELEKESPDVPAA